MGAHRELLLDLAGAVEYRRNAPEAQTASVALENVRAGSRKARRLEKSTEERDSTRSVAALTVTQLPRAFISTSPSRRAKNSRCASFLTSANARR